MWETTRARSLGAASDSGRSNILIAPNFLTQPDQLGVQLSFQRVIAATPTLKLRPRVGQIRRWRPQELPFWRQPSVQGGAVEGAGEGD